MEASAIDGAVEWQGLGASIFDDVPLGNAGRYDNKPHMCNVFHEVEDNLHIRFAIVHAGVVK